MWPFNNNKEKAFIQSISQIPEATPDIAVLLKDRRQPLFVCDDMMHAHQGSDLIKSHATRVARGFTKNKFDFRVHEDSGMGIPLMGNVHSSPLRIKGEVHSICSERIKLIDFAYGNGIAYHRTKVGIIVPGRMFKTFPIGEEEAVKDFPPGSIKTLSERGLRRYTSDRQVSVVSAWMYVASKQYWNDHIDGGYEFPRADILEPKEYLSWLPRYYKYPINLNRTK